MYNIIKKMSNNHNNIIGICGCGFVGGAVQHYMAQNPSLTVLVYDKYKNDKNDKNVNTLSDLLPSTMIFICLPTPFDAKSRSYNMCAINETIYNLDKLDYTGTVIIKSTVLPDYCCMINSVYPKLKIFHNPEFLSAQTARDDFARQSNIILGHTKWSEPHAGPLCLFFRHIFPHAAVTVVRSEEASLVKLGCNAFYATKVQFFTELYLLCQKVPGADFDTVRTLMLHNGNEWIHPQHTQVPGPDGQVSYGGACLPKDIKALDAFMQRAQVGHAVTHGVIQEQASLRK